MTWTRQNNNWKKAYNKLAEDFFTLQHEFDMYKNGVILYDPEEGTPELATESCCGQTTFSVDSAGVVEHNPVEGDYKITVTRI